MLYSVIVGEHDGQKNAVICSGLEALSFAKQGKKVYTMEGQEVPASKISLDDGTVMAQAAVSVSESAHT